MQITSSANHRYATFGRGATVLEARLGEPLPLELIRQRCPAVFAEDKHSSRSERYSFISTANILEALGREGFHPHLIMQGGSRDEEKRGYTKHLIRFRQETAVGRGGTVYEVCLLGSHDGTTAWQAFGGFFRALCKNGCIWFEGEATKVVIPHKGNVIHDVIDATYRVLGESNKAYDSIDNLRRIELNRDEQLAFASAAAVARFEDDKPPVQPQALLAPRREADRQNDLWTTFNRVQENVIRGGISYTTERELADGTTRQVHRHTRPVQSVDGDVRLNRALWTLASEMAKIKSAA